MLEVGPEPDELDAEDEQPLRLRGRKWLGDDVDLDITPMIDVTFLLLIFFLVASVPDARTSVTLPPARHGSAVGSKNSVIITVAEGGLGPAPVFLADGRLTSAQLDPNPEKQAEQIRAAVEAGLQAGTSDVLLKAEAGVPHREVARIAAAASQVEGIRIHIGVMEVE